MKSPDSPEVPNVHTGGSPPAIHIFPPDRPATKEDECHLVGILAKIIMAVCIRSGEADNQVMPREAA